MDKCWFCTHLSNLLGYRLRLVVIVGQAEVFTNFVQRCPVFIIVVLGVLDDNTVRGSRKLHVCSRLSTIVQLDFVHVL